MYSAALSMKCDVLFMFIRGSPARWPDGALRRERHVRLVEPWRADARRNRLPIVKPYVAMALTGQCDSRLHHRWIGELPDRRISGQLRNSRLRSTVSAGAACSSYRGCMRLRLDKSACAGHALCNGFDEELFPLDDSGYSEFEDRELAPAEVDAAQRAAQTCPEAALLLEDGA